MTTTSRKPRLKILYVEDEVIVALDVADGLSEYLGLDVTLAHNLATARRYMQETEFDLALLDMNLGNGESSTPLGKALRANGTRVVFASGYNRFEIDEIADFDLIEKPFTIRDVASAFGLPLLAQG